MNFFKQGTSEIKGTLIWIYIMSIGARLRTERLRLGLSQAAIGTIGGVKANAQGKYEGGVRLPRADYLASVAAAGIDVLYVITGKHMENGNADLARASEALDNAREYLDRAKARIN